MEDRTHISFLAENFSIRTSFSIEDFNAAALEMKQDGISSK